MDNTDPLAVEPKSQAESLFYRLFEAMKQGGLEPLDAATEARHTTEMLLGYILRLVGK